METQMDVFISNSQLQRLCFNTGRESSVQCERQKLVTVAVVAQAFSFTKICRIQKVLVLNDTHGWASGVSNMDISEKEEIFRPQFFIFWYSLTKAGSVDSFALGCRNTGTFPDKNSGC